VVGAPERADAHDAAIDCAPATEGGRERADGAFASDEVDTVSTYAEREAEPATDAAGAGCAPEDRAVGAADGAAERAGRAAERAA